MTGRKQNRDNPRFKDILDAAAKVFRKKGYYHATISDVAREVGLQKGSLYHHIKGKEELLYEIIMSALDLYLESLRGIVINEKEADIVLKKAIMAHMQPIDIHFDQIYVFLNEMGSLSREYKKQVDIELENYERLWIEILEGGKASGLFRSDLDSKMTMLWIFGMCNWILRWYRPKGSYNTTELAEMYARNILDGIRS